MRIPVNQDLRLSSITPFSFHYAALSINEFLERDLDSWHVFRFAAVDEVFHQVGRDLKIHMIRLSDELQDFISPLLYGVKSLAIRCELHILVVCGNHRFHPSTTVGAGQQCWKTLLDDFEHDVHRD